MGEDGRREGGRVGVERRGEGERRERVRQAQEVQEVQDTTHVSPTTTTTHILQQHWPRRQPQRHLTKNGVRAQIGLVGCPIQTQHQIIQRILLGRVLPNHCGSQHFIDRRHRLQDTLSHVPCTTVAQFTRFVDARGGSRWNGRSVQLVVCQHHVDFDGRVASGINDFTCMHFCHGRGKATCGQRTGGLESGVC